MPITAQQLIQNGGPAKNVGMFGNLLSTLAYELYTTSEASAEQRDRIVTAANALVTLSDKYSGKKAGELTAEEQKEMQELLDQAAGLSKELTQRGPDGNSIFENMIKSHGSDERQIITNLMQSVDQSLELGIGKAIAYNAATFTDGIRTKDFLGDRLRSRSMDYKPSKAMKVVQRAGIPIADPLGDNHNAQLENAFVLYLLSEENMSVDDLANLKNLPSRERTAIGDRFLKALEDHPMVSDITDNFTVSWAQKKESAAWYGNMTKKAVDKLKADYRYPKTEDLTNPFARTRLQQSKTQLIGQVGFHIDETIKIWRDNGLETNFAQAFGGVQGLQSDINAMKSAGAVHIALMRDSNRPDPKTDGPIFTMAGDFLNGLSGRRIDTVNAGGDLLKGDRAFRDMNRASSGKKPDEFSYSDAHEHAANELFSDAVFELNLADLDPYIDAPDLENLSNDELDKAAALFDERFQGLIQKEKNLTDVAQKDFNNKSITGNFLIIDNSDKITGMKEVNASSMVDQMLLGKNVSAEQREKYKKAYILHMIAETKTTDDIMLQYKPFQIKTSGPLHAPVHTVSAPAASMTFEAMGRKAEQNLTTHFETIKKSKQDQLDKADKQLKEKYDDQITSVEVENDNIKRIINLNRQHDVQYNGNALFDVDALKSERAANYAQNHEIRVQRMNEEMQLAQGDYAAQRERWNQHCIARRKNAHQIADKIRKGEVVDDLTEFDEKAKEKWPSDDAAKESARTASLNEKYKINELNLPIAQPMFPDRDRMSEVGYRAKRSREVYRPAENEPPLRDLNDALSSDRRTLLRNDKGKELKALQEMFNTKKKGGIFNRNSDEYKTAKNDLEEFMRVRDNMAEFVEDNMNRPSDNVVLLSLQEKLNRLNAAEEKLKNSLGAYIRKVTKGDDLSAGTKGIENMTQDAGAARLSGAVSILDALALRVDQKGFDRMLGTTAVEVDQYHGEEEIVEDGEVVGNRYSDKEMEIIRREAKKMDKMHPGKGYDRPENLTDIQKNELLNQYAKRIEDNKVHITNFAEVYQKNYSAMREAGSSNVHRESARKAQMDSNSKIGYENIQRSIKKASEDMERDTKRNQGPQR